MSTMTPELAMPGPTRVPPAPANVAETGLSPETIIELILKTLHVQGARTGMQITEVLRLPFDVVDEQLLRLQERRFVEVLRTSGPSRAGYVFDLAGEGRDRAQAALDSGQYVGAAPVPLRAYREWIGLQSVGDVHIGRERIREGFSHLVVQETMLEELGPAINSASSLFLHGDPGNGKTVIAEAIAGMLGGDIYIPYAVEIDGQIMSLFDPVHHEPIVQEDEAVGEYGWLHESVAHDRRFVRIRRPVVFVGGELMLHQLDLQFDPHTKMYQAPFQLKAAGGVLIIDDFGRQLVAPRELLNRWIVPLEKRIDFLTLHTGVKFPVPFDCLIIFATNLDPHDLVDEAFLRRIRYKINVTDPDRSRYDAIFRMECERRGIAYDARAVDYVFQRHYGERSIPPRACHPRDLLDHVEHAARYEGQDPELTPQILEFACRTYFMIMAHDALDAGAD